jgi:hypothetical protein
MAKSINTKKVVAQKITRFTATPKSSKENQKALKW